VLRRGAGHGGRGRAIVVEQARRSALRVDVDTQREACAGRLDEHLHVEPCPRTGEALDRDGVVPCQQDEKVAAGRALRARGPRCEDNQQQRDEDRECGAQQARGARRDAVVTARSWCGHGECQKSWKSR
jgi:hypothetical protein